MAAARHDGRTIRGSALTSRRRTVAAVAAASFGCLLVAGCGSGAAGPTDDEIPELGSRMVAACLDTSRSVPASLARDAVAVVTASLRDAYAGPSAEGVAATTVLVRRLDPESGASAAVLGTAALPPVPAQPALSANPYDKGQNDDALAAWETQVGDAQRSATGALARLEKTVKQAARRSRDIGTDLPGCLNAVSLSATGNGDAVVVASDFVPHGHQESLAADLQGARVVLLQWCGDRAAACTKRTRAFADLAQKAGAGSVDVLDVTAVPASGLDF